MKRFSCRIGTQTDILPSVSGIRLSQLYLHTLGNIGYLLHRCRKHIFETSRQWHMVCLNFLQNCTSEKWECHPSNNNFPFYSIVHGISQSRYIHPEGWRCLHWRWPQPCLLWFVWPRGRRFVRNGVFWWGWPLWWFGQWRWNYISETGLRSPVTLGQHGMSTNSLNASGYLISYSLIMITHHTWSPLIMIMHLKAREMEMKSYINVWTQKHSLSQMAWCVHNTT